MRLARGFGPFGAGGYDPPLHREDFGLPRGWIDGLVLANNGTDATNDVDIAAGVCRSTSNIGPDGVRTTLARHQRDIELAATVVKQLDVTWAPGNNGGRSSSSISNTTWHVYAIGGRGLPDDILLHDGVDPSAVLPAGYTAWRRIGAVRRESAALAAFEQRGDTFLRATRSADVAATNPGTSAVLAALAVPGGVQVEAIIDAHLLNAAGTDSYAVITSPFETDATPAAATFDLGPTAQVSGRSIWSTIQKTVRTNTSRQIRYRLSHSSVSYTINIWTRGWIDPRGRNA